jgi:hypothetical protein
MAHQDGARQALIELPGALDIRDVEGQAFEG